jgi:hypothetical protein
MSRRVSWIAAGVAGLFAVSAATAASALAGQQPVAAPHWSIIKSVKNGEFTAVVATGKTTGWAFNGGNGTGGLATAWKRTGGTWTKVAFPSVKNEYVAVAGGTSPSDVWAFTDTVFSTGGRVLSWTGSKWSVVRTFPGPIYGASVVASNDVWVFGYAPGAFSHAIGVWHYNGHTWTQVSKTIQGGSALSATDVWAFNGTDIEHWNGHAWAGTSVKKLLPPVIPGPLNDPAVTAILALSDSNVYAVGNGNDEDDGGPIAVLHYNGVKWVKVAQGLFGYGPGPISYDGSGGLWIPLTPNAGGLSYLAHYTGGKLLQAKLPVSAPRITVTAVSRIPGSLQQLAAGYTHPTGNLGSNIVGVLLQYS